MYPEDAAWRLVQGVRISEKCRGMTEDVARQRVDAVCRRPPSFGMGPYFVSHDTTRRLLNNVTFQLAFPGSRSR